MTPPLVQPLKESRDNVYEACDDALLLNYGLDRPAIIASKHHQFTRRGSVTLDRSAPDYEQMFVDKGEPISADEVLESRKPLALKVPLVARGEFAPGQLPLLDLLKAIQYYASHTDIKARSLDESALLAVGMIVEQWADEMVDENAARMFLQADSDIDPDSFKPDLDSDVDPPVPSWPPDDSDSDVISVDLEESDTEDEQTEIVVKDEVEDLSSDDQDNLEIENPRKRSRSSSESSSGSDSDSSSDSSSSSDSDSSSKVNTNPKTKSSPISSSSSSPSLSSKRHAPQSDSEVNSGSDSGSESGELETDSQLQEKNPPAPVDSKSETGSPNQERD